jgi:hypothetical protein
MGLGSSTEWLMIRERSSSQGFWLARKKDGKIINNKSEILEKCNNTFKSCSKGRKRMMMRQTIQ